MLFSCALRRERPIQSSMIFSEQTDVSGHKINFGSLGPSGDASTRPRSGLGLVRRSPHGPGAVRTHPGREGSESHGGAEARRNRNQGSERLWSVAGEGQPESRNAALEGRRPGRARNQRSERLRGSWNPGIRPWRFGGQESSEINDLSVYCKSLDERPPVAAVEALRSGVYSTPVTS